MGLFSLDDITAEEQDTIPEQYREVENLAGLGYTIRQLSMYFNRDFQQLLLEYADENSPFRYHYDRGRLIARARVDMATLESAQKGNISAQQIFNKRSKEQQYKTLKEQLFGRSE